MMLAGTNRNPISTVTLLPPTTRTNINPRCVFPVPLPQPPPGAHYALFVMNIEDPQTPGQMATTDFLLLPMDNAIKPIVRSIDHSAGMLMLSWPTVPGRMYKIQASTDLMNSFFDVFVDLRADTTSMDMMVPMSGDTMFYRIGLQGE